jgi:CheY-like chemotaxis protein
MKEVEQRVSKTRYILVVDPNANERFTMSMLLQRFGYPVATAVTVQEGIDFLCVAPAVAVFTEAGDVGSELRRRLAADARFREVPLVFVADTLERDLEQLQRRGELSGLLRKPLSAEEVFKVVQEVVEKGSRRNIRVSSALPAVLLDEDRAIEGYITVLSQFGMFFRSLSSRPAGSRVGVRFTLWGRIIRLEAMVLYVVSFEEGPFSEPGMGMKFVQISVEDSALVRAFILEHCFGDILPSAPELGYRGGIA